MEYKKIKLVIFLKQTVCLLSGMHILVSWNKHLDGTSPADQNKIQSHLAERPFKTIALSFPITVLSCESHYAEQAMQLNIE